MDERDIDAEQAAGFADRMENSPPIGAGPDGTVVVYQSLDEIPDPTPEIISAEGSGDDDISDLDELDELIEPGKE